MPYSFQPFKDELKKVDEWLLHEFASLHTGRAAPAILDSVSVEAYGSRTPIQHLATVSIEDPRTLRIAPWDKAHVKEIERAISAANLGLSVSTDDMGLRVSFPSLSAERREMLIKLSKAKLEEARISVRTEREKVWTDIQAKEKDGLITEDEKFRYKDELQKFIDEANSRLEEFAERKEKDILS
jgi:ribosome recycling factor